MHSHTQRRGLCPSPVLHKRATCLERLHPLPTATVKYFGAYTQRRGWCSSPVLHSPTQSYTVLHSPTQSYIGVHMYTRGRDCIHCQSVCTFIYTMTCTVSPLYHKQESKVHGDKPPRMLTSSSIVTSFLRHPASRTQTVF